MIPQICNNILFKFIRLEIYTIVFNMKILKDKSPLLPTSGFAFQHQSEETPFLINPSLQQNN